MYKPNILLVVRPSDPRLQDGAGERGEREGYKGKRGAGEGSVHLADAPVPTPKPY